MLLADLTLDEAQRAAVSRAMIQAQDQPTYPYPWDGLTEEFAGRGLAHVAVIGYGSLLNSESAAPTLGARSLAGRRPVLAFGARRLFTRAMPSSTGRYGSSANPRARAALNIRITGRQEDVTNGVLIPVALDDVDTLCKREQSYDLVPVACLEWQRREVPPFTAYILASPEELWQAEIAASPAIEPHPDYFLTCRRGAAEFGGAFLQLWLATTYLADGVTPVSAWERARYENEQESEGQQPA